MTAKSPISVFWFRRDLRVTDNHGLFKALSSGSPVLPIFIFDRQILDKLDKPHDLRVQFIHQRLSTLQQELSSIESSFHFFYSSPLEAFKELTNQYEIQSVHTNHDYEPYAIERDEMIRIYLQDRGIPFFTYKDQVIFDKDEVLKDDGTPYSVFTPYSRKWKQKLNTDSYKEWDSANLVHQFVKMKRQTIPSLQEMGFSSEPWSYPAQIVSANVVKKYSDQRNFPALPGTSKLGIHLRFGTVSIRKIASYASKMNETFLNELIWRDFYHMILYKFPNVGKGLAFKKAYDLIQWRNNEAEFDAWCHGQTGYPIVDAGMRELSATGFMHNRVRMITASFLTKHLLIDWRWGEAWFASKLLDFDLAANNGGWQWASGSGCDAAPYFRVFNPALQTEKFDKEHRYIQKWVPEYKSPEYVKPIVEHDFARKRCLETYGKYLKGD